MAYVPQPSERQSRQSILQELQQQKQQLLQQGGTQNAASLTPASANPQRQIPRGNAFPDNPRGHPEATHAAGAAMSRRSALEYASAHSNGYFVAVDSQFGNTILPAIPRLDDS